MNPSEGVLAITRGRMGSVCTDPLQALRVAKKNANGFRIHPLLVWEYDSIIH